MPFLPVKPFIPVVTPVPILGPSSGNPQSLRDPKSLGSIGSKLQAMTDQANADTLYDTKESHTNEGFVGLATCNSIWEEYIPLCNGYRLNIGTTLTFLAGISLLIYSIR